jgi:hypothetical protein
MAGSWRGEERNRVRATGYVAHSFEASASRRLPTMLFGSRPPSFSDRPPTEGDRLPPPSVRP